MRIFNTYNLIKKPRNNHQCAWCKGKITTQQQHLQYTGMFQGDFQDWRVHEECIDALEKSDPSEGICPEPHEVGGKCNH